LRDMLHRLPVCGRRAKYITTLQDLRFSWRWLQRMPSSGMLHHMALVWTDVPLKCEFLQEQHGEHPGRRHSSHHNSVPSLTQRDKCSIQCLNIHNRHNVHHNQLMDKTTV
jgi:hypothetical protein